jgi:hypothetical protein
MENFTAHHLLFTLRVVTPIQLNAHKGSSIRGALFHALRHQFCFNREARSCAECPLHATCPVAFLVATLDDEGPRGREVPRPYTIEPPLEPTIRYEPDEGLSFGLTLFTQALNLFPYVILAVHGLEQGGLGRKVAENGWRRGTFTLQEITALNPLTGERQTVLQRGDELVEVPDVPVTHAQVMAAAEEKPSIRDRNLKMEFLTPTRLIDEGQLVSQLRFRPLLQRLLERLVALAGTFCDTPFDGELKYNLVGQAEAVETVADETRWVDLESYSTRRRGRTHIGGLVGRATFRGDLAPFLPWLIWGQFTHVGKNAVKGDGWYRIADS